MPFDPKRQQRRTPLNIFHSSEQLAGLHSETTGIAGFESVPRGCEDIYECTRVLHSAWGEAAQMETQIVEGCHGIPPTSWSTSVCVAQIVTHEWQIGAPLSAALLCGTQCDWRTGVPDYSPSTSAPSLAPSTRAGLGSVAVVTRLPPRGHRSQRRQATRSASAPGAGRELRLLGRSCFQATAGAPDPRRVSPSTSGHRGTPKRSPSLVQNGLVGGPTRSVPLKPRRAG
jgi:hypothetical protein